MKCLLTLTIKTAAEKWLITGQCELPEVVLNGAVKNTVTLTNGVFARTPVCIPNTTKKRA